MTNQIHSSLFWLVVDRKFVIGLVIAVIGLPVSADVIQPDQQTSGQMPSNVLFVSPDIDTSWRYTKFGWQDVSNWFRSNAFEPRQTIELLHPLVWSGIVLISVIATMIWASSEWDFARLFQKQEPLGSDGVQPSQE